ncbi:recombinase family protein [[Clostridium] innocuum]|uniref:Resolvase n=1 Tax=Clostridium innocuum TaxID=1522 RepID=A0A3E2VKG5_CLOIN|nr:recombinase family protein [[Clostridium] innocuum]MBS6181487.1 recombinase family protein [Erysipelotrichaceae bacterium]MCR0383760.1 recombinase family protein [[Clostridium] innocuum]MCR0649373.1 recombinase family protein [[Clostridium] innocuum]RGC11223.1 resolvase [[Clostridium] innocuum]
MKIFGYARRSSSEKSKSNYSIESQKRVCNELAARDDRTIEKWYVDEGYSGTTLKRPHMQEMLRDIAAANQEIIIYVWLASRLSRDANHCNSLRYVFSKYNVTVISDNRDWASLEDIELHPDKTIGPRIITLSDETEVHRDRKRTRIGLTTSAYKGNYTKGGKTPPTGYLFKNNPGENAKGRRVEIDAAYVETMLYILTQIHDHKRSLDSLAIELDSKLACGVHWSYVKIYRAVTDPIIYGRLLTSYVDIQDHSPAYCSQKYYEEIQKVLHGRRKENRYKYLFKNLIKCGECDSWCSEIPTIHYSRNGNRKGRRVYKYYYCPSCKKRINEQILLNKTIHHINAILDETTNFEVVEDISRRIGRIEKRLEFLDFEYEDGYLDDESYIEERKKLLSKKKNLDKNMKRLRNKAIKKFNEYTYIEKKQIIKKSFLCIRIDLKTKSVIDIEKLEK